MKSRFYDPDYNRVLTMQDGIGTTVYSYNSITLIPSLGAGMLASVSGPLPNSLVTYQYDPLSRMVSRAINGVAEVAAYDVLDRPVMVTNALGAFQYSYINATARLASEAYPNGQTNLYTYYNNLGDQRLLQIQHIYPNGSLLSGFGYAYNPVGQITAWTNQWDTLPTRVWLPSYDAADQLTNIVSTGGPSAVTNYSYAYDFAGNRLVAATNGVQTTFSYSALNQLVSSTLLTNNLTYEWDVENRLTAINNGTNRSEFYYDGLGRRTEIIEKVNDNVVSNNYYLWCGTEICEQRDFTGANVIRRFFGQGEQLSTGNYYYTRDHLGSVREALDSNGTAETRYDYDPYGQQAVIQEYQKTAFAYTGDFIHVPSKLYLTLARPLDTANGRWLGRDPLDEFAGLNLYSYVGDEPLSRIDLLGYDWVFTGTSWLVDHLFPDSLVNVVAGGQPYLNAVQGGLEGYDPSDGGLAAIYSWEGLAGNRCSKSYRNGKLIGTGYGLVSGTLEIRGGIKAYKAAKRLPLFTTGGNGMLNWGSISRQADQLANDIKNAKGKFGEHAIEDLSGAVVGEDQKCKCQSQ